MITDAATNATVWLDGEDERVLHELLASSRAVGRGAAVRAGRGGVVVTEDGERLVMHYNAEAYQSLDSVLQVFEMMWEDYEAVPENVLPLYCELDLFGFQAAGEAILRMHGGMHEMRTCLIVRARGNCLWCNGRTEGDVQTLGLARGTGLSFCAG